MAVTKKRHKVKHKKAQPKHKASHHGAIPAWAKSPTPVPPALLQAIYVAAKKYHVPPDVLAGIWRGESGSTYPNPYRNSLGYGGLFGTKLWNGSTQAQADYAASILHTALVSTKGDLAGAINIYQTGKSSSRSYDPPGAISSGVVPGYGGKPSGKQTSTSGNQGLIGKYLPGPVKTVLNWNPFSGGGGDAAAKAGAGAASLAFKAGAGAASLAFGGGVSSWVEKIVDAFAIAGGGFIFIFGFALIATDIGLSSRANRAVNQIPLTGAVMRAGTKISRSNRGNRQPTVGPSQLGSQARTRKVTHVYRDETAAERRRRMSGGTSQGKDDIPF